MGFRLSPPERRYADVSGLSDWPRYPDSGLAEPRENKLHTISAISAAISIYRA